MGEGRIDLNRGVSYSQLCVASFKLATTHLVVVGKFDNCADSIHETHCLLWGVVGARFVNGAQREIVLRRFLHS